MLKDAGSLRASPGGDERVSSGAGRREGGPDAGSSVSLWFFVEMGHARRRRTGGSSRKSLPIASIYTGIDNGARLSAESVSDLTRRGADETIRHSLVTIFGQTRNAKSPQVYDNNRLIVCFALCSPRSDLKYGT